MQSFEQAERARDSDALIAHFAAIPEFHIYSDGTRLFLQRDDRLHPKDVSDSPIDRGRL